MFYFYLLQSQNNPSEIYTGSTSDLKKRVKEHNEGKSASTKRYIPWLLAYYEAYVSEKDARLREHSFKKHGKGNQELKKRIANSLSMLNKGEGFTLMEIIVVLGLLSLFAVMGLVFSFDSYRGYFFRSEYTMFVNLLEKARNRAANNFNESGHGVAVLDSEYRLFRNDIYDPDDDTTYESYPKNSSITFGGPTDIRFFQLSGNIDSCDGDPAPCEFTFGYANKTKEITINAQGGITW